MALFKQNPLFNVTPAQSAAYSTPRPITAAASRINLKKKDEATAFRARRSGGTALWQAEAWEYYDAISEIKYAFNLVASVTSRITLYAAVIEDPAETPVNVRDATTIDPALADSAERILNRLNSAYGGQAGLLRDAALNLSVAGECHLVQIPEHWKDGELIAETWDIRSVDELQNNGKNDWYIAPRRDAIGKKSEVDGIIPLPSTAFTGRIWRAHPRFSEEPDSSVRGVLDLCSDLLLLDRAARATFRSRLNAGMLYMPDGLSSSGGPDPDAPFDEEGPPIGQDAEEAEDDFEEQLISAMTTPIEDESSASAVVPLIVRGPADLGDKIKKITFERTFDEANQRRADRLLERILQGIDVPKDTVTGLANVKYSNAVQIDESLYKAHIEPLLLLISDAITVVYLRPYLLAAGYSEAEVNRVVVWFDPSAVATRNDRAADADSGFDKGAISYATWRRAHGFSDADAPNSTEMVIRMMEKNGSLPPDLIGPLLQVIAPEIMEAVRAAQQASSVAPVTPDIQSALNGEPGAPVDPNATPTPTPTETPAEPEPAPTPAPVESDDPVEPGEDAPPAPLT